MEFSAVNVASTLVLVAVVAWVLRVVDWLWLRPKRLERCLQRQGLRGTKYKLFFGDVRKTSKMVQDAISCPISLSEDIAPRVLPFAQHVVNHYGKVSYSWNGPVPNVIVTRPGHIKEVFSKVYDFPKPEMNPLVKLLATGLLNYNGDKWAKHRKIVSTAFHLEKLKRMMPEFIRSCNEMICKWDDSISDGGSSSEVDVWTDLAGMTSDVISRTAFGSNYEEGKKIFQLIVEQGKLVMQAFAVVYIPGWRFLPTKNNRRMKQIDQEMRSSLRWIIEKKVKAMNAGTTTSDDLLGILLESNSGQAHGGQMSIEDVIQECRLFYFAGQETTSVLLLWTMVLLSHHQDWQARAREEIHRIIGRKTPDLDSLSHLKTVTMILYEVLRLYPPLVLMTRAVTKEMKLGDLTLPAGVELTIPALITQRDQDIWGVHASEFRPERFAEGISKATKNQVSFFPFGWGQRMCLGQAFALIEAKLAVAMILQRFRFELSSSYIHAPYSAIALHPQFGVRLVLHKLE